MIQQLRIYEIFEHNKAAEAAKNAAWAAFLADDEWKAVKRTTSAQHGDLVGAIEDRVLVAIDYSPAGARGQAA